MKTAQPPIIKKIMLFGILSGAISLLLACVGFGIVEFYKIKSESLARVNSQIEILIYNLQPTLLFEDKEAADKILLSLQNAPSLNRVRIYKNDGREFTAYIRMDQDGDLKLTKSIQFEGRPLGRIEIESHYVGLRERYLTYALVSLLITIISIPCLFIISAPLRAQVGKSVAQLVETTEALKRSNQDLEQFAYVASHDLKAPLRGIASLVDWISSDYTDKLDDNGKEQLGLLAKRVRRMHDLIDGILQYSKVQRTKEEKTSVNFNELVKEVIDSMAVPEHIEVKIEGPLPTLLTPRIQMEQLFQNLLSNAVKFIDKPRGLIRINGTEEGDHWRFSIADNGPGIDSKYYEKIFQIFQTLASREETESTGVGLAIVKKIVENNGGKVWVESQVGSGTTFLFTLSKSTAVV